MSRQPDFASARRPHPQRTWERAAVALGVLAVALVAVAATRVRADARVARAQLARIQDEIERLSAQRGALASRATAAGGADASSAPARIVAAIAAVLPADARLGRLAIDYRRGTRIEMHVVTRSTEAWDRLLERLEGSTALREVAPGAESRGDGVDSVVRARWDRGAR